MVVVTWLFCCSVPLLPCTSLPHRYLNWLELPTSHPNYKCFALYGPHGCGKSMLCAGMCTITADKLDLRPNTWHFTSGFNINRQGQGRGRGPH